MMLLLDSSFPAIAEAYSEIDFSFTRWNGARLSDEDLVAAAAEAGFAGVVFLGQAMLSVEEVIAAGQKHRIYLAATAESAPPAALRALATNIAALRRRVRNGGVDVIYARDVRDQYEVTIREIP